jgi:hypothetical protein
MASVELGCKQSYLQRGIDKISALKTKRKYIGHTYSSKVAGDQEEYENSIVRHTADQDLSVTDTQATVGSQTTIAA